MCSVVSCKLVELRDRICFQDAFQARLGIGVGTIVTEFDDVVGENRVLIIDGQFSGNFSARELKRGFTIT